MRLPIDCEQSRPPAKPKVESIAERAAARPHFEQQVRKRA
jgi:hypothetical protein